MIIKQEIRIIDGVEFYYEEYDKSFPDGTPFSSLTRKVTSEELQEQVNLDRIAELKALIDNKNYLGDSVTVERAELRTLLGL